MSAHPAVCEQLPIEIPVSRLDAGTPTPTRRIDAS